MEVSSTIPQKLFFRIGEVCELIQVQPHVLRYWETEFPMLSPQKNRAGQRVYRRKDVEMVMRIRHLLYEEKFTIAGAKRRLVEESRSGGVRPRAATRGNATVDEEPHEVMEVGGTSSIGSTAAPEPPASPPIPAPPTIPKPEPQSSSSSVTQPALFDSNDPGLTPAQRIAIQLIRRDLVDLLTLLKSDASING